MILQPSYRRLFISYNTSYSKVIGELIFMARPHFRKSDDIHRQYKARHMSTTLNIKGFQHLLSLLSSYYSNKQGPCSPCYLETRRGEETLSAVSEFTREHSDLTTTYLTQLCAKFSSQETPTMNVSIIYNICIYYSFAVFG